MAEDHRPEVWSNLLIKLMCAAGLFVALALLGACEAVLPKTVPANIKGQFLEVAQRLRSFPPWLDFGGDSWPLNPPGPHATPGATEYQRLMQSNHPVPTLLSLLKDRDPKIRTLAAAALVARGEPRLQQYLGPLVGDQSQTFDQMYRPPVANFVPTKFIPQTVATAVLRLVEYPNKADFDRYWAFHANREYCADWFLWQLRHKQFAPLARQHLQSTPSPDRDLITLWIGTGRQSQYDGFRETELVEAAKSLGPDRVLAVLRGEPPGTDPDIKPRANASDRFAYEHNERYSQMAHFLLAHAKEILRPADAQVLLSLESEERRRSNRDWLADYGAWWLIAAASLQPERSDQILLTIDGEAMYRFAEFAQKAKVNFDQQFVDWIYAQPADPIPRKDYASRRGVIEKSGVAQKLVRDSRFSRADGQLLYDIKQSLVGGSSRLSRPQSVLLDSLIKDIDLNHPQSTPKSKLQEIRNLLRKDVGE